MTGVDLICIDVDGTLVDSTGAVPEGVWGAVKKLREAGVRFALCSGRPAFGVSLEYAQQLDVNGWHIFQNGASIVRPSTGETNSTAISPQIIHDLIDRSRKTSRVLELYTDHDSAVESHDDRAKRHADLLGIPFRPRPFSSLTAPIVRAQWLIPHTEREAVVAEPHEGLNLCPSLAPLMPDTVFVNMTAEGIDKGSALRVVTSAYGLTLERVMMIGDGDNDVGALRIAGFSVAMGNASALASTAARFKVKHVDNGGLLEALAIAANAG